MRDKLICTCGAEIEGVLDTPPSSGKFYLRVGTAEVCVDNHWHEPAGPSLSEDVIGKGWCEYCVEYRQIEMRQGMPFCTVCEAAKKNLVLTDGPAEGIATELFGVCGVPLVFPADDDPAYEGDTAVTSKCRHTIHVRPVEPAAPVQPDDPCKMNDAQYEEYIYGPNRAKWPTNEASQPAAPAVQPEFDKTAHPELIVWRAEQISGSNHVYAKSQVDPLVVRLMENINAKWNTINELRTSQPTPAVVSRLDEFQERIRFEQWYAANRMGLYMRYGTRLRLAIEDTARASWFEGKRLALSAQPAPLPSDLSLEIRKQLWLTHGCGFHCLYGDDGEMSCNRMPFIDFMRSSESEILKGIDAHHWLRIAETQNAVKEAWNAAKGQKETK